jgi:hypothetical protein
MEDLKLAFETIIVGLLAIPWLFILIRIPFYLVKDRHLLSKVRTFLQDSEQSFALIGTLVLGIAYCLGTIIFPIADNLFNGNHNILGIQIKKDGDIRSDVLAELYFEDRFYKLSEKDFPATLGLPEAIEKKIEPDALRLLEINKKEKEEGRIDSEAERKGLYKKLNETFHSIYNYQKYTDYNSSGNYEILKPLNSRIVVLRGAVFNGICLLVALICLILAALLDMLFRWRRKAGFDYSRRKVLLALVSLIVLNALVWIFSCYGASGVTAAEKEYGKHIVGLFYGRQVRPAEERPEPQAAPQSNNSSKPAAR